MKTDKIGLNHILGKLEWADLKQWDRFKQSRLAGWALFLCLSLAVSLVINGHWGQLPTEVKVGSIAMRDIRADRDYLIVDQEETSKIREGLMQNILPIFDWDEKAMRGLKVVEDKSILDPWQDKGILVRQIGDPEAPLTRWKDLSAIVSLEEARHKFQDHRKREKLAPTLLFNSEESQARQEKVLSEVQDVIITIKEGQAVIRSGDHFEPWHVKVINGMREIRAKRDFKYRFVGSFFFAFSLLLLLFIVGSLFIRGFRPTRKDLLFCGFLLSLTLIVERVFSSLAVGVGSLLPFEIPSAVFNYLVPVAFGAMLVRLLLNPQIAIFFALAASILAGVDLANNLSSSVYFLFSSLTGIILISHARSRLEIFNAGAWTGLLGGLFVLVVQLISVTSEWQPLIQSEVALAMGAAFLGGILSSTLIFILTPLIEAAFGYLTDIKLLELGSLNHPLLEELIVRAPGTYHHSHMVGTLAEAAAESIGANGLFARIASYFHDIGKMTKSEYFIENESGNESRHQKLTPSMSALVIASHVKDGMDLGREYKLPQQIIDIIPQHQGTKLISYFYSKAKEQEEAGDEPVNEKDYRYPGPKPQSREAGIILLSDTVEAATRALKDRSPVRIEEVVRNMINKNFIDGQLDECDLTLRDLNLIAHSFVRILMGIYHKRIEYPAIPEEVSTVPPEHATDKYTKPKPLTEGAPDPKGPPPPLRRIGPR
ncbi:MAG: HDIG domain-containing protein [Deltaproteobacteria bacterium]|nr:HDIG domain-containing protein [Deltaproteobacteria bacterium]